MSKSIQLKDKNNEKCYPHPYYPIGSIFLSVVNTNPSTWFGGTWVQIAKGRTLVGVDTNDTDFNTVQKTGGSKTVTLTVDQIPNHRHVGIYNGAGTTERKAGWGTGNNHTGILNEMTINEWENLSTGYTGGGQAHTNLQPYFTCYIWCRTA